MSVGDWIAVGALVLSAVIASATLIVQRRSRAKLEREEDARRRRDFTRPPD